jgi:hypothetical protein
VAILVPLLVLMLLTALVLARRASRPVGRPAPSIHQIQQLSTLVTARVVVADMRETMLRGRLGQARALMVVRGEVLLGPDLALARIVKVDPETRLMHIELPRPRVLSARLDHQHTRLIAITHAGLWHMVPGDAGRTVLVHRAYAEAEHHLHQAAASPGLVEQASTHAERVLNDFFSTGGWKAQVTWTSPP